MAVAKRAGVTTDVPEPDDRRARCWHCREWYTWPLRTDAGHEDEPASAWPQFESFIGAHRCLACAEKINQRRENDGSSDEKV